MKKSRFIIACVSALALVSCAQKNTSDTNNASETTVSEANVETRYEGVFPAADGPGVKYDLTITSPENSSNGTFVLTQTYLGGDNGKDETYTVEGKRYTQRGMPGDDDATIWQLKSNKGDETYNFLYDTKNQTLTMLNDSLQLSDTGLNYTLKKIK